MPFRGLLESLEILEDFRRTTCGFLNAFSVYNLSTGFIETFLMDFQEYVTGGTNKKKNENKERNVYAH